MPVGAKRSISNPGVWLRHEVEGILINELQAFPRGGSLVRS